MQGISEPGALNYYFLSQNILLTSSVFRNPTLTNLPLFRFQDSLLCDLITLTPSLEFFLSTLAVASSFSSGRDYPSLNFLPPLSTLDPYFDYVGVNISLNSSSSLSFLNVYAPPICSSLTDSRTDSFSPSIILSSRYLFILGDFNYHLLLDSKGTCDIREEKVCHQDISLDLLPLNDPDISTLLHQSSGSHSSPLLPLSCSWEVLHDFGSNHPTILQPPFFSGLLPQRTPPFFNCQKTRYDDFGFTLTSTVLLRRNTGLFLLLLLSLPL